MKCSINLTNVTPEQVPALMSTLSVLGISFHLHYHSDEINDAFSTPKRLQVTPVKKPMSNPSMMCAFTCCTKVGGFYNRECHPRVYYCAEHKPDETYKTHKTFTFEGLRGQFCGERKRSRPDDDGWLESRTDPQDA